MTTLTLSKKTSFAPSEGKKPVRRLVNTVRDRRVTSKQNSTNRELLPSARELDTQPILNEQSEAKSSLAKDVANKPSAIKPLTRQQNRSGKEFNTHGKDLKSRNILPSKVHTDTSGLLRVSKLMANRGICSRREADDWIVNGWVKVNGVVVDTLGTRTTEDANIVISEYARRHQLESVTILLHKPIGYVSGQAEDGYTPAVVLIKPEYQWQQPATNHVFQPRHLKGLAPAGRLDIDSTGLLVFTQDGRLARHLIGDDSQVEKEYLVRVEGALCEADLKKLNYGLSLDGVKLKPAKVSWQNEHQLRFVLREGRKRQIRRMCELVGLKVIGLKRIRIGSIALGKLPVGEWRYLSEHERF